MDFYAIIVAGGSGIRMQSDVPKQFMELVEKPVLMHTIERFVAAISEIKIILVLSVAHQQQWQDLCNKYNFKIPYLLANGGETRFHSVKNGLALVPENSIVGIHDAARPLVGTEIIRTAYETAEKTGNACPAVPVAESIREVNETRNKAVDRNRYYSVQTPQCFQSTLIKKAFLQDYQSAFTDDASVLEASGTTINIVAGNRENIKITTPVDLILAEALIKSRVVE